MQEEQDKDRLRPDDRFIRMPEVRAITGRSKTQIYDDLTFPRPIKLSKRESAWIEREVREWMQARVNAARGKAA
jgi:prophage regulatory protein